MVAVLTVNYVIQDGRSNWLEGMILMCKSHCNASLWLVVEGLIDLWPGLYLILGVTFWFYPGMSSTTCLAVENSDIDVT